MIDQMRESHKAFRTAVHPLHTFLILQHKCNSHELHPWLT